MTVSLYIKGQRRLSEIKEVLSRSKTAHIFSEREVNLGTFRLGYHIDVMDKCEDEIDRIIDRWHKEDKK